MGLKTKRRKRVYGKWQNRYYVDIYILASKGYNDTQIAGALSIPLDTFKGWKKRKPTVKYALKEGKNPSKNGAITNVLDFVYDRLPDTHKELYDEIMRAGDKKNEKNGYERVRKLLENEGEDTRKMLFLYAIVNSNFNKSAAMKKVCVSTTVLSRWMKDPEFTSLMDRIHDGMKDFYEGALVQACADGETQAIIFANRTKNKDRGYGDKLEMEHTGKITHEHTFQLDIAKLSLKAQREVFSQMEAFEKQQEQMEEVALAKGNQLQIPHRNGNK